MAQMTFEEREIKKEMQVSLYVNLETKTCKDLKILTSARASCPLWDFPMRLVPVFLIVIT